MSSALKRELKKLAIKCAEDKHLSVDIRKTAVLFERDGKGLPPDNLMPASYREILGNPDWHRRLTSKRADEPRSCNSSDALLMNIMCHPGVLRSRRVAHMLGFERLPAPAFGYRARITTLDGEDSTDIDLRLTGLLAEAKLTETDFTRETFERVHRYRDFDTVFDRTALPRQNGYYLSYELIRNVLAARQHGAKFLLLCDARRPDLIQHLLLVLAAVRDVELRTGCSFLTWQQIAAAAPVEVRKYLAIKYGINGG